MNARIAERIADLLDRHSVLTFGCFTVIFAAAVAVQAEAKPFWYDEIHTILHAQLRSVPIMWTASRDGIDLSPPLNAIITHAVLRFSDTGRFTIRLPPIVAYWVMSLIVFHLVRRRSNTLAGLSAALLPCFTAAYRYSYEARGYALMLGLFAVALLSWSEAARGRRRATHLPLVAVALAAGLWNQYYAIFVLVPIGVGELVRLVRDRAPDWTLWGALAAGCAGALPMRPLMRLASESSSSFWRRASLADFVGSYRFLFSPLRGTRFVFITATVVVLMATGVLTRRHRKVVGDQFPTASEVLGVPAHEIAAGLACLAIPFCAVAAGVYVTGVFVPRYALTGVIGLSLVVPLGVWRSRSPWGLADLVLCASLAGTFGQSAYLSAIRARPTFHNPVTHRPVLLQELAEPGPVAVTDPLLYLQVWYYLPEASKSRLIYLADAADWNLLALKRWSSVTVEEYSAFVLKHREFLVYAAGSDGLLHKLRDDGATFEAVGGEQGAPIYRVTVH